MKPEVAIMIEGQMGLNWPRWQRIGRAVEELGFAGLFRSDHFTNPDPPDEDSLELWVSLTWLADHTDRIEFGPLVTPFSFRHPAMTARQAIAVDDLSGGRLVLGLGAGWQEREHHNFSYDLLKGEGRFERFEEGVAIIHHLLISDEPLTYEGTYYQFHDAVILPRPQRPGGPPILIGGTGPNRTLRLAAKYAREWNGVFITKERFQELNARLDEFLRKEGRDLSEVKRSLMTQVVFGRDAQQLQARLAGRSADAVRESGRIVGTGREIAEQVDALGEAGVQRVMLQWLYLDDLDGLAALAGAVL